MKFDMKRPLPFKGGVAATLVFSRVNVAGMLELASLGDILSPEASARYACQYGTAVTPDGLSFGIEEEDILSSVSPAPSLAAVLAFNSCREFDPKLGSGEVVPPNPFDGGEAFLRLRYPISAKYTVGTDDHVFQIEWLSFEARQYRDVSDFVRSYMMGKEDTVQVFIRLFASIKNAPEGYPLQRMTDLQVGQVDASDAERIAKLVMENFIEVPGL